MADEILDTLRDLADNAEFSSNYLRRAKRAIIKANKEISAHSIRLEEMSIDKVAPILIRSLIDQALEIAPSIYAKEIDNAVAKSVEFANPLYHSALLSVANEPNLVSITPRGRGFSSTVNVVLNMNTVAGDIEQWANAVDSVRANLGVKEDRDATKASKYWRTKIYGTGTYDWTLAARFSIMGGIAPFWLLLDQGNTNTQMSSSIGGTPYPKYGRPTNFVLHTEDKIKKAFLESRNLAKAEYDRNIKSIKDFIFFANEIIGELNVAMEIVRQDISDRKTIAKRFNVPLDSIDSAKFDKARERALNGERGIAELGKRGSRRIRASLSIFEGLL